MVTKRLRFAIFRLSIWRVLMAAIALQLSFGGGESPQFKLWGLPVVHAARKPPIQPVWPHEKSDLAPDPALEFNRLSNGFRFVLMKSKRPKDRVSMHLVVQVGSVFESEKEQGLAHFLEHMVYNGSTHFKPGELVKYLQRIGMDFGPDANAHTGYYETVYEMLLPDSKQATLEEGLMVFSDFAKGALLMESEVERERKIVLAEKRTRDSADYRTWVSTLKFEFPEAVISRRLPIGTEPTLNAADSAEMKAFYDRWYRPEKIVLVMVGDMDTAMAGRLVTKTFSGFSSSVPPGPEPEFGTVNHKGIKAFYHFEKEAGTTSISIEALSKAPYESDSLALQQRLLTQDIADRIVQDRLDTMLSRADTPFTSASIYSGVYLRHVKSAEITARCSQKNWKRALSSIEQTLRRALIHGFAQTELDRVKKDFQAQLENAVQNAATRKSQDLARDIISNLNNNWVFQSPRQEKRLYAPFIDTLTLAMVNNAFKETWAQDHRLVLVTGNAKVTEDHHSPEEAILAAYRESAATPVAKPIVKKALGFPYLPDPSGKGRIAKRVETPDRNVLQIDFENGVRLNLKKTDFKADQVIANVSFGYGKSVEPADAPGLAALCNSVINESGLGRMNKDELERALAGKSTSVSFTTAEDKFLFEGDTVSKEVPLLFQLFYAYIMDPGYRPDAYALSMKRFKQYYERLSREIEGAMALSGNRFLAGGDSRFGLPAYAQFKTLGLDRVRSWIDPAIRNEPLEISVVGDFEIEPVIELAARYFGTLPARHDGGTSTGIGRWTRGLLVHLGVIGERLPRFPAPGRLDLTVDTRIPKGLVTVAYPSEDFWDIQRTRRFSVLADVASERLRVRIREELGAAYSQYAYNRPSRAYPGYGAFQNFVHVNPKDARTVVTEVQKIMADLAQNGVTAEQLQRALDPTVTRIKDMLRQNAYWLNNVLTGSARHPEQLVWNRTFLSDYAAITPGEISALAAKYLVNGKAVVIVVKPAASVENERK